MSQDYTTRLRELAEDLRREARRVEVQGRAPTDAEIRRVDALRTAEALVLRALEALAGKGEGVTRGDPGGPDRGSSESIGFAGDDDTPGYGRGGGVRG
jgi:hypothetical protein